MDKWISVKDKLPENCESVIFYAPGTSKDGSMDIGEGFYGDDKWFSVREEYEIASVTFWQPMPKPPEKLKTT